MASAIEGPERGSRGPGGLRDLAPRREIGVTRRRLVHGIAAADSTWPGCPPRRSALAMTMRPGPRWRGRRRAFLASLPADGRRRAVFAFDHAERRNWGYVPRSREGMAFKEMPAAARTAAHELMKASLSAVGYGKAVERHPAGGGAAAARDVWGAPARSREILRHRVRRSRTGAVGLAARRSPSLPELHDRARQAHRRDAGLHGRESRRGALGPAQGSARAGP